ncbi:Zinc finger protein [Trichinella papuae]|uniref:Zinc finger protein n=1 Tax=Trichinella papuae TaxID=268474 RepID=A0A0V1MZF5_9BILA|nr:Zinc finger protein [Trichinella papuae]
MIRDSTRKRVLALLLLSLLALCTSCLVVRGVVCHVHGRCVKSGQARHGKENDRDKLVEQRKDCSLRRQKPNLRCPDCKQRFAVLRYMKRHVQRMHALQFRKRRRTRLFKCTVEGCRKRFYSHVQLMDHRNTHNGLKPYLCEEDGCQPAYCCRSSLQQHMKRVHLKSLSVLETVRFFAQLPSVKLASVPAKNKQELKSPKDKRRPVAMTSLTPLRYNGGTCNGCTDRTGKQNRRRHYKCTVEGCGRQFYSQIQLMDHGNPYSGLKPYVCEEDGRQPYMLRRSTATLKKRVEYDDGYRTLRRTRANLEKYFKRKKHATTTCSWRRSISSAASLAKDLDRGEAGKSMRNYIRGAGACEKDANGCLKATTN